MVGTNHGWYQLASIKPARNSKHHPFSFKICHPPHQKPKLPKMTPTEAELSMVERGVYIVQDVFQYVTLRDGDLVQVKLKSKFIELHIFMSQVTITKRICLEGRYRGRRMITRYLLNLGTGHTTKFHIVLV